jgi:hypothetical protein
MCKFGGRWKDVGIACGFRPSGKTIRVSLLTPFQANHQIRTSAVNCGFGGRAF